LRNSAGQISAPPTPCTFSAWPMPSTMRGSTWTSGPPPDCAAIWISQVDWNAYIAMNASATVFSEDIYRRYFNKNASQKQRLRILYAGTVAFGLLGMITGVAMTGAKSILDMWWVLSGIFAAGMLGIFLLGILSRQTGNHAAIFAAVIGVLVIFWMTFSDQLPASYAWLRSPFNMNMTIVIGTLSIFLAGILFTKWKTGKSVLEKM